MLSMPDWAFPPPPAIHTEAFRLGVFMSLNMQRKETAASEVFTYISNWEFIFSIHSWRKNPYNPHK